MGRRGRERKMEIYKEGGEKEETRGRDRRKEREIGVRFWGVVVGTESNEKGRRQKCICALNARAHTCGINHHWSKDNRKWQSPQPAKSSPCFLAPLGHCGECWAGGSTAALNETRLGWGGTLGTALQTSPRSRINQRERGGGGGGSGRGPRSVQIYGGRYFVFVLVVLKSRFDDRIVQESRSWAFGLWQSISSLYLTCDFKHLGRGNAMVRLPKRSGFETPNVCKSTCRNAWARCQTTTFSLITSMNSV